MLLVTILFVIINPFVSIKDNVDEVNRATAKELEVFFSTKELKQGEYIKIIFTNINDHNLRIETDITEPTNYKIYFESDKAYAFIPVSIAKEKGLYNIKIFNNDIFINEYEIMVIEDTFEIQKLTISEQILKESRSDEASRLYQEAIKKARSYNLEVKFYEDSFIMPAEGRITTEFGIKRYVNNSTSPSRHYGIDIANKKGTPIKAPASGMVTYAGFLPSAGNYIVIDHGMGLLSYYAHLDSLSVKELEMIKQGQLIGYMGTTGFSTGSHLHFALSFREVYTNPWQFIEKEVLEE